MNYKIPKTTALSFLTTIAATGCGINGEDDLPGSWRMQELEKQCSARKGILDEGDSYEANICFNFTKFAFEVADEGLQVENAELRGYIVQSYLYSKDELFENNKVFTQYTNQFYTEDGLNLNKTREENLYTIQTTLTWKDANGNVPIDVDLDCNLTKKDTLMCSLQGIYIEGNNVSHYVAKINDGTPEDPDMIIDAWHFTLKKDPEIKE